MPGGERGRALKGVRGGKKERFRRRFVGGDAGWLALLWKKNTGCRG